MYHTDKIQKLHMIVRHTPWVQIGGTVREMLHRLLHLEVMQFAIWEIKHYFQRIIRAKMKRQSMHVCNVYNVCKYEKELV